MYVPKMCRIGLVIDDLDKFGADARALLGLEFLSPALDEQFTAFSVLFGEHGVMAIQPYVEMPFTSQGRLIEVAVDVENADRTRDLLVAGGYKPLVENHLPEPDAYEYLFGRDFHNIPIMVCTRGHNEAQMRVQGPFRELEEAPFPKVSTVVLSVEDIDRTAADLTRFYGMTFVECDPLGLGTRALTGRHRIILVEGPSSLSEHFAAPLAALGIACDAVEDTRRRLEDAGLPALLASPLKTGGTAYHFGAFHHIPLLIYPASADAELIGEEAVVVASPI